MHINELNTELAPYVTVSLPADGDAFSKLVKEIQDYLFDMGSHSDLALDMAFALNAEAREHIRRSPEAKAVIATQVEAILWKMVDVDGFVDMNAQVSAALDSIMGVVASLDAR